MLTEKLMKPAQFAEHQLLTGILKGEFPPGTILPGERKLAEQIGVTRPTLRETLQKMAREGWLNIRHGKSTMVKDYMSEGGMGVLSTMARFGEDLPKRFVEHFLKVRCVVLPSVAKMTMEINPEVLESYLLESKDLDDNHLAYTDYDWKLQLLMATQSGNPFFRIILNDFDFMYRQMGADYFLLKETRAVSLAYYNELLELVRNRDAEGVYDRVARVMDDALALWKAFMA
ncbi:MAG: fatty acid metabolism transcriptional regulator FadR [Proteobacteria bacterium]|nr:fatty acid metabolism transcriptional regulator FadR [Pseudomonadota bacterium]